MRVNLYFRGRRYRVFPEFKRKFHKRAFDSRDFLGERNQELRRLMLGHGASIQTITSAMRVVDTARDEADGRLLEFNNTRYLHVVDPSTKQEYLLQVPRDYWDRTAQTTVALDTAHKARRWTFNLPADAEFVAEA
jgi:hypothetical protein